MKLRVTSESPEQTKDFAKLLGGKLRGGEILQLKGDVGAGKTTFVIGLAEGMGSIDDVSSPTFTICNTYHGDITLHHCDFYRLHDDKLIENELADLIDGEAAVVLEWAENISAIPAEDIIEIEITPEDETSRTFDVTIPEKYGYIGK